MDITWQEIATIGILLVAACYVVRRIVRFFQRKGIGNCTYCSRCQANMPQNQLVQLEDHLKHRGRNDGRR